MTFLLSLGLGIVITAVAVLFAYTVVKLAEYGNSLSKKYGEIVVLILILVILATLRVYLELV